MCDGSMDRRGMHIYTHVFHAYIVHVIPPVFLALFRSNGKATGDVHSNDIVSEVVADNASPFIARQGGGPARQVEVRAPFRLDAAKGGGCEYGA